MVFFILGLSLMAIVMASCGGTEAGAPTNPPTRVSVESPTPGESPTATMPLAPTSNPTIPAVADLALGEQLVQANACWGCHTTDGRDQVGPTWQGLYGSVVPFEDGTSVVADEEYLRESITEPNYRLVRGFLPDLMPTFEFTSEELDSIIAYIKSLER